METDFFAQPILNSPYDYPSRHWELDSSGQPTGKLIDSRRRAAFITPIPKPRKRKGGGEQRELVTNEVSDEQQQYATNEMINSIRVQVDAWRRITNPNDWGVTPESGIIGAQAELSLKGLDQVRTASRCVSRETQFRRAGSSHDVFRAARRRIARAYAPARR